MFQEIPMPRCRWWRTCWRWSGSGNSWHLEAANAYPSDIFFFSPGLVRPPLQRSAHIYIYIYVWMRLDGHVVYTCICYVYMGCMICRSMCFILEKGSFRVKHWIRKMSSGCDDPERSTTRIARWLQGIRIQREIHRLGMTAVETCWNYNHAADVSKS